MSEMFCIFALKITSYMLIGREKEIQELRQAYDSEESKFVAIFGRRRIGKTYLVREVFHDKFAFSYS